MEIYATLIEMLPTSNTLSIPNVIIIGELGGKYEKSWKKHNSNLRLIKHYTPQPKSVYQIARGPTV